MVLASIFLWKLYMILWWNSFRQSFFRNCFAMLGKKVPAQWHAHSRGRARRWLAPRKGFNNGTSRRQHFLEELSHRALKCLQLHFVKYFGNWQPLWGNPFSLLPQPVSLCPNVTLIWAQRSHLKGRSGQRRKKGLCELAVNKPILSAYLALTTLSGFPFQYSMVELQVSKSFFCFSVSGGEGWMRVWC